MFIEEYREHFNRLVSADTLDAELYEWLTTRTNKINLALGPFAVLDYKPAFANYIHRDYPIIPNALAEIRLGETTDQTVNACDDCMLRGLGMYQQLHELERKRLWNPLIWLREGVSTALAGPAYLFSSLGLIKEASANDFRTGKVTRILSGILSLLVLLATAIGVIVDWAQFAEVVKAIL